jgi:hypothetical protein
LQAPCNRASNGADMLPDAPNDLALSQTAFGRNYTDKIRIR